jgi:hypothetical protein
VASGHHLGQPRSRVTGDYTISRISGQALSHWTNYCNDTLLIPCLGALLPPKPPNTGFRRGPTGAFLSPAHYTSEMSCYCNSRGVQDQSLRAESHLVPHNIQKVISKQPEFFLVLLKHPWAASGCIP